jgi:sulfhydrogenase subunit beta (sulfur reductase)
VETDASAGARLVLAREGLRLLMQRLLGDGLDVIGPRVEGAAVVLGPVRDPDDLPTGISSEQDAGCYRLHPRNGQALFAHGAPAHHWKRYLYPPSELLSRMRREPNGFSLDPEAAATAPRHAFFGVRPCDLNAFRVLDAAIGPKGAADVRYMERREKGIVIVANCTGSAATCFCASMETGPQAKAGFDLAMTELEGDDGSARYVVASGSPRGAALLDGLPHRPATADDLAAEAAAIDGARTAQTRSMVPDVASLLRRNLEHRQWAQVAERCLACANCTLVCPTCFCATVEETTTLAGDTAERWRKWDSCFTSDFSYIHGGSIRRSGAARYRQWMTHKLSSWWQQFEMSGCVGCGRCIAWCPVGIDITEEARSMRDSEGGTDR